MSNRGLNLFISYSHADTSYLQELKKYLTPLRRNKVIRDWCDLELVAGDSLDEEISKALQDSDLFVFLISADFLASWYCFDVELAHALSRIKDADVRVMPLIVRNCPWEMTELKKFVAIPKDGVPVSSWSNDADAYTDAVARIEKCAQKVLQLKGERSSVAPAPVALSGGRSPTLTGAFSRFLEETEITYSSKLKDHISRSNIYVFPDLVDEKREREEIQTYVGGAELVEKLQSTTEYLVHGAEQSGKTALSKAAFSGLHNAGCLPLWIEGRDVGSTDVMKLVQRAIRDQYDGFSIDSYLKSDAHKVLVVDDFHLVRLNAKYLPKLLTALREKFDAILIISDSSIKFDEGKYSELFDFEQLKILPLGYVKRAELINKWNSLGCEETVPLDELFAANDNATRYVDALMRKNVLPAKPIYLLTTLSLLDAGTSVNLSISSYGHCYQAFIQHAFSRAGVATKDIDTFINYLSELAFYIYEKELQLISAQQLEEFEITYRDRFVVRPGLTILDSLLCSGIIKQHSAGVAFSYKYIYYFYVAKYFTDHLDIKECKAAIERLCWDIHSERNANILVFVVHHSKDPMIITEILERTSLVFDGVGESTLVKAEVEAIEKQVAKIPKIVLEARNVEEERSKVMRLRDKAERIENGRESEHQSAHGDPDAEDIQDEILADISRSYRMVEVIGQVLRNRHGSLPKAQMVALAEAAYATGLRFLAWYLRFMVEQEREILSITEHYISQDASLSNDQVTRRARAMFLSMCYATAFGVIIKIAHSVGSEPLMPIYDELLEKHHSSPAIQLIGVAIKLEFTKKIPRKEIHDLHQSVEGNPIVQRLLEEIVVRHLYLNPVTHEDRGWIASTLKLEMKAQRLIQSKKQEKV